MTRGPHWPRVFFIFNRLRWVNKKKKRLPNRMIRRRLANSHLGNQGPVDRFPFVPLARNQEKYCLTDKHIWAVAHQYVEQSFHLPSQILGSANTSLSGHHAIGARRITFGASRVHQLIRDAIPSLLWTPWRPCFPEQLDNSLLRHKNSNLLFI